MNNKCQWRCDHCNMLMGDPNACCSLDSLKIIAGVEAPRIYISGPVTGMPNLNREAFDAEERILREAGYETFNPHSVSPPGEQALNEWGDEAVEKEWQYYMRICIGQIPLCDEMRMLPDWQNSKGAVWEHRIAKMLGLGVTYCYVPDPNPKW